MKQPTEKNQAHQVGDSLRQSPSSKTPVNPKSQKSTDQPKEFGGRKDGLDPTRYGDWEKNGRCIDF